MAFEIIKLTYFTYLQQLRRFSRGYTWTLFNVFLASFYMRQKVSCTVVLCLSSQQTLATPVLGMRPPCSVTSRVVRGWNWVKYRWNEARSYIRPDSDQWRISTSLFVYVTICINNYRQRRLHIVSLRPLPGSNIPLLSASPTKYWLSST